MGLGDFVANLDANLIVTCCLSGLGPLEDSRVVCERRMARPEGR